MSFIRTVLGDISPVALGVTYAHEHIIIDHSYTTELHPEFLINDVDKAVAELVGFRSAGGQAMVDSMPVGGGRNVVKLAEVSRRSGVHILCPTGMHLAKYYAPDHWAHTASTETLVDIFTAELTTGTDDSETRSDPTQHRAGLIKIASGLGGPDGRASHIFEAAAQAHRITGAPILTHTEQGTGALEQCRLLADHGVDLTKVTLSHTDRKPDRGYHREILATGVNVEFDSAFRWPADKNPNPTLKLLVDLVADGYTTQLMLGMDTARRSYWTYHGGSPGLTYLLADFTPALRAAGLSQAHLDQIFVHTPARAFAFP